MPLIDSLGQWLRPRRRADGFGHAQSFPEREQLRLDQRELADALESTFQSFDAQLRDLAERAYRLTPAEYAREASRIRAGQDQLRRAIRRLEASVQSTTKLEQDLAQWERHPEAGSDGPYHADHPRVRAEILRSELAIRRGDFDQPEPISPEASDSRDARTLTDVVAMLKKQIEQPAAEPEDSSTSGASFSETAAPFQPAAEPLPDIDPHLLVAAIRDATREAERWHAVPLTGNDHEALIQIHHVRELHALLKRIDRARGIRRDRLTMAIRLSEFS